MARYLQWLGAQSESPSHYDHGSGSFRPHGGQLSTGSAPPWHPSRLDAPEESWVELVPAKAAAVSRAEESSPPS